MRRAGVRLGWSTHYKYREQKPESPDMWLYLMFWNMGNLAFGVQKSCRRWRREPNYKISCHWWPRLLTLFERGLDWFGVKSLSPSWVLKDDNGHCVRLSSRVEEPARKQKSKQKMMVEQGGSTSTGPGVAGLWLFLNVKPSLCGGEKESRIFFIHSYKISRTQDLHLLLVHELYCQIGQGHSF